MMLKNIKTLICLVFLFSFTLSLPVFGDYITSSDCYNENNIPCDECCGFGEIAEEMIPITNSLLYNESIELPDKIDLSQDKFFPQIREQKQGSCTAWAMVYYMYTYEVARLNNWDAKNDDTKVFSPRYVWSMLTDIEEDGTTKGVSWTACCEFMSKNGALRYSEFPEIASAAWYQGETYDETVSAQREAFKNKVSAYNIEPIYDNTEELDGKPVVTSNKDEDLNKIKMLLNSGHPLAIVEDPFSFVIDEIESGEYKGESICINNDGVAAGHIMTIVGYDDTISYDLDDDGVIQDYERGALKVANSWGPGYENDGYIWILYDAINEYSNVEELNISTRGKAIANEYATITVENCEPSVTVEVTLNVRHRNALYMGLSYNDDGENVEKYNLTFNKTGGAVNGSGNDEYEQYTFVFDYGIVSNEQPGNDDNCYSLIIGDDNKSDEDEEYNNITTIEKIRWVDSEGNLIKELTNQGTIDGNCKAFMCPIVISSLSFNENHIDLYYNQIIKVSPVIYPSNSTNKDLIWTSSNQSVATVGTSGNLYYEGEGDAVITATTKDGSNLVASFTVSAHKDYADSADKAMPLTIDNELLGEIEVAYDKDFFKFIAPNSGKFIFNTEGYTDTIVYVYDCNNNVIGYNDDYSQDGYYNFAVSCDMIKGETYYIKVIGYETDTGEYSLIARKAGYDLICDVMQNGRHIMIEGRIALILDTLSIQLGGYTYNLTIPEDGSDIDTTINGIRFCINFREYSMEKYMWWDIDIFIPSTQSGVTEDIICTFSKEDLEVILDLSGV